MTEEEFRSFLFVQAAEESDPDARIIRAAERARATAEAAHEEEDAFLRRRTRALLPAVESAFGGSSVRTPVFLGLALALAAFVFGASVDQLGGGRRIHLLSLPLLGLLVWNGIAYVGTVATLLGSVRVRSPAMLRLWCWVRTVLAHRRSRDGVAMWRAATATRFLALWIRSCGVLEASRIRRVLHFSAASFAGGAVVGLYVRGFALEYRASWESTFLGPDSVARVLEVLFGPAAVLLGIILPDAAGIAAIRMPNSDPAASWIHLWAATITLGIILPRLAFAAVETWNSSAIRRNLRPDRNDPYVLHLLAPSRGEGFSVALVPYGYRPVPSTTDAVREIVLELFGSRSRIESRDPLPYGADPPTNGIRCLVILFSLAQTPELEVHGEFLASIRQIILDEDEVTSVLILLDLTPFAMSAETAGKERVAQRIRSWMRVLRDVGLEAVVVPQETFDETIREARRGVWPPLSENSS